MSIRVTPLHLLGLEVTFFGYRNYLAFMPFTKVSLAMLELIVEKNKPVEIYAIECLKYIRRYTIEPWCFVIY